MTTYFLDHSLQYYTSTEEIYAIYTQFTYTGQNSYFEQQEEVIKWLKKHELAKKVIFRADTMPLFRFQP